MKALLTQLCIVMFTATGLFAQVPSYVPTNGLVGWWPFNGNANDESGNGNHGTVNGAALTSDKSNQSNKAYSFNGSSNYITIASSNNFQIQNSISVSVWILMSGGSTNPRVIQFGNDNFNEYGIETQGTSNVSRVVNGFFGGFPCNFTLTAQTWHNVVYSCNRTTGNSKIYFDGILVSEYNGSSGSALSYVVCNLTIGRKPCNGSDYFGGKIDDIGIWNRVLTQAEITALYQAALPVTASASTISNVSCYNGANGSATVVPGGGTGPYTYSWNTSPVQTTQTAMGLRAGTYTVTVTDSKGASTTANTTITQPTALTNIIASTVNDVSCYGANNGSVRVTNPAGGTPPYTYYWNTNPVQVTQTATNLIAGTYTVVVTDANGCNASSSATVSQPAQPLSNITGQTIKNVTCNGNANGIMTVTNPIGGTPPYSYTWYTSPVQTTQTAINVPAGTYSVKVTDANGCSATSFATITEPTKLTNVIASPVKHVQCFGESNGSATVSQPLGGTPPYSYQWNTVPPQSTQTINNIKAGEYTVVVTDANGCIAQSFVTITQPSAPLTVGAVKVEKNISCYGQTDGSVSIPNPSGGTAPYTISWNTSPVKNGNTISGLTAGTYTATITDAKGCTVSSTASITQPNQVVYTSPKDTLVLIHTNAEFKTSSNNPQSTFQWQTNTGTGYQNLEDVYQYSGVKTPTLLITDCATSNNNQPFRCIITTNGCYDTTKTGVLTIRTNVGIAEQVDNTHCIISPNPTGEAENIKVRIAMSQDQDSPIELVDMLGKVHAYSFIPQGSESVIIPTQSLPSGMYIVRLKTSIGIFMEKLIVQ